jgi:hypothetical protein
VARFCFLPTPLGTETTKARALTKPPVDAHNVTQNRKICGCPRFALPPGRAVESGHKKPQPELGLVRSQVRAGREGNRTSSAIPRGQLCFVAKLCEASANNLKFAILAIAGYCLLISLLISRLLVSTLRPTESAPLRGKVMRRKSPGTTGFDRPCAVWHLRDGRRGDNITPPSDGMVSFSFSTPLVVSIMRCTENLLAPCIQANQAAVMMLDVPAYSSIHEYENGGRTSRNVVEINE